MSACGYEDVLLFREAARWVEIAVKKLLEASRQGEDEMKNEVALIAKLHLKNLVRLLVAIALENKSVS